MTHYIYIPGFGDRFDFLRRLALRRWKRRGVSATLVPMRWTDKSETFEQKYARVAEAIRGAKGEKIILVGESAGGAMAVLTFSRHLRQASKLVTICGYNHGVSDIHPVHHRLHPAFHPLCAETDKAVQDLTAQSRQHIVTMYSTRDTVVEPHHSRINGTREVGLRTPGHFLSIARVLLAGPDYLASHGKPVWPK